MLEGKVSGQVGGSCLLIFRVQAVSQQQFAVGGLFRHGRQQPGAAFPDPLGRGEMCIRDSY